MHGMEHIPKSLLTKTAKTLVSGQSKQFNESPKKRENSFDILRIHAMGKLYLALGLTTFCESDMDTFCQHAALNSSVLENAA